MVRKSPELFCQFLDVLAGQLSYAKTARTLRIPERTVYNWIKESKAAKEAKLQNEYVFEWGGESNYFHVFLKQCVSASVEEIEAAARLRARDGTLTPAMYRGQTVYKRDPKLIGLAPDILEMLSVPDDLLRDENGDPVPEMVWTPPSTDLVQLILQSHTQKYKRQSTSNIHLDVNNRHSGGVMVAGQVGVSAALPAPPPMLEIVQTEEPEPVAVSVAVEPEPAEYQDAEPADEPQAMASEPEPAPAPLPRTNSALTPLQRDLLERARAPKGAEGLAARTAPIKPFQSDPDDFDPARVGAGNGPPPGGVKVR